MNSSLNSHPSRLWIMIYLMLGATMNLPTHRGGCRWHGACHLQPLYQPRQVGVRSWIIFEVSAIWSTVHLMTYAAYLWTIMIYTWSNGGSQIFVVVADGLVPAQFWPSDPKPSRWAPHVGVMLWTFFPLIFNICLLIRWLHPSKRAFMCQNRNSIGLIFMTSSNGNIFHVTGHLCGEFTGPRWIPRTKASDAELWCFLWSAPE